MRRLLSAVALFLVLGIGGCWMPTGEPVCIYPVITKPELGTVAVPDPGQYAVEVERDIWEQNTYTLMEYAEALEAAVDAYNEFARHNNGNAKER